MTTIKRLSIVKQLNDKLHGNWKAVRDGFGWKWVNDQGREVKAYAESIATYDGYSDDEFATVYIDNNGVRVGSHGFIRSEPPHVAKEATT